MHTMLSGQKAREFVLWLEKVKNFLPPKMSIGEAKELFERKLKDEEELKGEVVQH